MLYAIGGMSRREASKSGEKFDPKEGKWKPIGTVGLLITLVTSQFLQGGGGGAF